MFGRIHQYLPAITAVLGFATVWADASYLPRGGPLPLRFRLPPESVVNQASAPIPPPPPPPIFLPTPLMPHTPPDTTKISQAPAAPGAATNGLALEFDAREFPTGSALAPAPEALVSPQMLLKYFTNSSYAGTNLAGNATSLGVVAPLGFNPPPVAVSAPMPPPPGKPTTSTSP